jgi:hypothetical protein
MRTVCSRELQFAWPSGWTVLYLKYLNLTRFKPPVESLQGLGMLPLALWFNPYFGGVATASNEIGRSVAGFRTAGWISNQNSSVRRHLTSRRLR